MTIADQSTIMREMVRAAASRLDRKVTFTPIRDPAGVGNGVHIHLSFLDGDGSRRPTIRRGKHELSEPAGQFVAGILKYLDAIVAITAPSVVSYLRLTPHRWSAAFNNLGFRDREASVRICPVSDISDIDQGRAVQFRVPRRRRRSQPAPAARGDRPCRRAGHRGGVAGAGSDGGGSVAARPEALAARGYVRLPQSLAEALERFAAKPTVTGWFPDGFADIYVKHKQGEIAFLEGKSAEEVCRLYEQVY